MALSLRGIRDGVLAKPPASAEHDLTRFVLLRMLGFVYLFAFLGIAFQIVPLVGHRGILPADRLTTAGPSIFAISTADGFLVAAAWLGVAASLVVLAGFANGLLLALLWVLHVSYFRVGQTFWSFGWEILLAETGFLAIFLVPLVGGRAFPRRETPRPVIWLHRWVVFRLMLGSGLIKLRGDCCWTDLTALQFHFETQPLPNPVSRWFHFAPEAVLRAGVLFNHLCELVLPWFVFGPPRLRRVAGVVLVLFQATLIASGNLSYLNWLTIVPCLACLDDGVWRRVLPSRLVAAKERAVLARGLGGSTPVAAWVLFVIVVVLSFHPIVNLLSPRQIMNASNDPLLLVNSYGAFGTMRRERLEIVLEGTDEAEVTERTAWKAYEFKAKPGDPARRPPFRSPYQDRLDWEMWFAAPSSPAEHPWLVRLLSMLLENDAGALSLLANHPFEKPPTYVRARLFRYRFTRPGTGAGTYWTREYVRDWFAPTSRGDPALRNFLAEHRLDDRGR